MPTTYTDHFYLMDPYSPPPAGTALTATTLNYVDQNDDSILSPPSGDTINGEDITRVWRGDTVTVSIGGVNHTYVGVTFYTATGARYFTPTDGTNLQNATFVSSTFVNTSTQVPIGDLAPPCFTAGTMIMTDQGERPVESLKPGDLVETLDHGLQPVRWIGCSLTDATAKHAPVVIRANALGNDRELRVSPQHRILIEGWQAELHFGQRQVLVPAKHLINGKTIFQEPAGKVDYYHLMFDHHEIIWSDGLLSESFFPGDHILMQDRAVLAELLALFPELRTGKDSRFEQTARTTLKNREAAVISMAA